MLFYIYMYIVLLYLILELIIYFFVRVGVLKVKYFVKDNY